MSRPQCVLCLEVLLYHDGLQEVAQQYNCENVALYCQPFLFFFLFFYKIYVMNDKGNMSIADS